MKFTIDSEYIEFSMNELDLNKNIEVIDNFKTARKSGRFFFTSPKNCRYLQELAFGICDFFDKNIENEIVCAGVNHRFGKDSYIKFGFQITEKDITEKCVLAIISEYEAFHYNSSYMNKKDHLLINLLDKSQKYIIYDTLKIFSRSRLWMIYDKCIGFANITGNETEDNVLKEYKSMKETTEISDVYTVDLVKTEQGMKIYSYCPVSCADFFNADINRITEGLKKYADI